MFERLRPNLLTPLVAAIGLLPMLAGCGPRSDRLAISGKVTLDSAPLDSGSIRFTSLEGQKLIATGGLVQNGQYNIPAEKGLPPGSYRVEISSPDIQAPPVLVRDTPDERGIPAAPERIPPEYNVNSQQSVKVKSDRANHFIFEIASRPSK